jgi:hypothetical protein
MIHNENGIGEKMLLAEKMMMTMEFLSCLTRKTTAASFTLYEVGF